VDDGSRCTLRKHGRHKLMTIESIAPERNEEITAAN
jgi:hypothetical protein